ncbi:MAG: hypothetical protein QW328_07785 [Nitrososphaerota archaeon]
MDIIHEIREGIKDAMTSSSLHFYGRPFWYEWLSETKAVHRLVLSPESFDQLREAFREVLFPFERADLRYREAVSSPKQMPLFSIHISGLGMPWRSCELFSHFYSETVYLADSQANKLLVALSVVTGTSKISRHLIPREILTLDVGPGGVIEGVAQKTLSVTRHLQRVDSFLKIFQRYEYFNLFHPLTIPYFDDLRVILSQLDEDEDLLKYHRTFPSRLLLYFFRQYPVKISKALSFRIYSGLELSVRLR